MSLRIAAVAATLALACGPNQYAYAPATTTSAEIGRSPTAKWTVAGTPAPSEVRVTMYGVVALEPLGGIEDSTLRALHVGVAIDNGSDRPWTFDGAAQRVELRRGEAPVSATTIAVERPPVIEIPPRTTSAVDLYFPLGVLRERDIPSFDLVWTLRTDTRVITERVPYERFLESSALRVRPPLTPGVIR